MLRGFSGNSKAAKPFHAYCVHTKLNHRHQPNMTSTNNESEVHIDWNGHQPSCQESRRVENHDNCGLTSIGIDNDDLSCVSSCSLSDEELNEIMMSLESSEMFEDQSDFSGIERQPLEYERNVPHKGGPFNGLACVSEN
eukprot:15329863-Ditylum_brightwellii.AAC.1